MLRCELIAEEKKFIFVACAFALICYRRRHYFVTPRQDNAVEYDYNSPLPLELSVVGPAPAPGQSFPFYVGDDLHAEFAAGRLRSVVVRECHSMTQFAQYLVLHSVQA